MQRRFVSSYDRWIQGQKSDLTKLLRAAAAPDATETELRSIIEQCMKLYEDYSEQRKLLAREDGPTFFSPPWCTSFENSVLWMGGCRPSLGIRLLYSLTGCEMEAHLEEFLRGQRGPTNVGMMALSASQLHLVNDLHQRTLRAEDWLSSRLAMLHEDLADKPLLPIIRELQQMRRESTSSDAVASSSSNPPLVDGPGSCDDARKSEEVAAAMQTYADGLAKLMEEADALRLATARTLVTEVLNPRQAVELLITAKELHLSLHTWGMERDHQHGRG
ncbi:transcription factor-like protein [Rhynchospora pubera]|uniref:Transcription factor-like protein n=1 Tax=Rhynchospora pubera TaxID=906938 RepID=A0AAV8E3Z1_9POAL|nr:transcription factor-like protein [Rhynchospora pubera]